MRLCCTPPFSVGLWSVVCVSECLCAQLSVGVAKCILVLLAALCSACVCVCVRREGRAVTQTFPGCRRRWSLEGGLLPHTCPLDSGVGVGCPAGACDFMERKSGCSQNVFAFPG